MDCSASNDSTGGSNGCEKSNRGDYREDELYVADCPALGTVSQGTSPKEALENLKEATTLYLEETGATVTEFKIA